MRRTVSKYVNIFRAALIERTACRGFFADMNPDALTWAAYAASLFLGFIVGFFFETCMGMLGFWLLEVTSLLYIVQTVNFFVSGHMFPLDLLPSPWPQLLKALPF